VLCRAQRWLCGGRKQGECHLRQGPEGLVPPPRELGLGHREATEGDTLCQTCDRMSEQDMCSKEDRCVVACTSPCAGSRSVRHYSWHVYETSVRRPRQYTCGPSGSSHSTSPRSGFGIRIPPCSPYRSALPHPTRPSTSQARSGVKMLWTRWALSKRKSRDTVVPVTRRVARALASSRGVHTTPCEGYSAAGHQTASARYRCRTPAGIPGVASTAAKGTTPIRLASMEPVPSTKASRTGTTSPGAMRMSASHTKPGGGVATSWVAVKGRQPFDAGRRRESLC